MLWGDFMLQEMAYVYEVYRERSFSKAAKNLYISQPALSTYVKRVENQIGQKIFDRNVTPIELTEAGRAYINTAEKILTDEKDLIRYLNDLSDMKTGTITIGGTHFYSSYLLPPIIKEFKRRFPGIQVQVVEGDSVSLYERIKEHPIDLIMDGGTVKESAYEMVPFIEETVLLCVPQENPINQKLRKYQMSAKDIYENRYQLPKMPAVPLKCFSEELFVLMKPGHDLYARAVEICGEAGFVPRSSMRLSQMMTAYNFCSQGLGVAFATDLLVKMQPGNSHLIFYRIGDPRSKRPVFLAYRKGAYMTKAMASFIDIARKQLFLDPQQSSL